MNKQFIQRQYIKSGSYAHVNNGVNDNEIKQTLSHKSFNDFASRAYSNRDGYAIRINPVTGKREMFIAGTRTKSDWFWNVADSVLYGGDKAISYGKQTWSNFFKKDHDKVSHTEFFSRFDKNRHEKELLYSEIARHNKIDTVFGHSRGGAYVADLALDHDQQRIGLDSAMIIARNKDLHNIKQGGLNPTTYFDTAIGVTGRDNVTYQTDKWAIHRTWGK